jgi:glycosyltransferase involved in cell wall biosynthesis
VLNVANGYFLPLLSRASIPTAVNVDGIEWERGNWPWLGKQVFRTGAALVARCADQIIVDSEEIGRRWLKEFGRPSVFLPYGADLVTEAGRSTLDRFGLPHGYVLAVARLVPENNIDLLLDALERLGEPIPVIIVGSSGARSPIETRLRQLAKTRKDFFWLGHVDDDHFLKELWFNAAVYFHGHSVGGTNPALLQAMGCGAPVVAVDTPYNREVIDGGSLLAPPVPHSVADLLRSVLADNELQRSLSQAGQARVKAAYSWDSVCHGYYSLLSELSS